METTPTLASHETLLESSLLQMIPVGLASSTASIESWVQKDLSGRMEQAHEKPSSVLVSMPEHATHACDVSFFPSPLRAYGVMFSSSTPVEAENHAFRMAEGLEKSFRLERPDDGLVRIFRHRQARGSEMVDLRIVLPRGALRVDVLGTCLYWDEMPGMLRKQKWGVGGIWDQPETLDLLLDYLEDRSKLSPAWEALLGPLKAKQTAETLEASWASASLPPSRPRM